MNRIALLDSASTTGPVKSVLEGIARKRGYVPTPVQVMAHSPVTLDGYMAFAAALARGVLNEKTRERIAIAVATANNCTPCLAAHTRIGKAAGLSDSEVAASQSFASGEPLAAAIMALARAVYDTNGHVTDAQIEAARKCGISDAAIVEIAGHIALNLLTNAVNSLAGVEVQAPAP